MPPINIASALHDVLPMVALRARGTASGTALELR